MYSCSSLGLKIGGAFGTAICGWLLDAAGYVENAATQSDATVGMLKFLYLWAPVIICVLVAGLLIFLRVEKANKRIIEDKENMLMKESLEADNLAEELYNENESIEKFCDNTQGENK